MVLIPKVRELYVEARFDNNDNVADWIEQYRQLWEGQFGRLDDVLEKIHHRLEKLIETKIHPLSLQTQISPVTPVAPPVSLPTQISAVAPMEHMATQIQAKLPELLPRIVIIAGFTTFLMAEQVNYLVSQSLSQKEAWTVAGLFEMAILVLSFSLGGNGGRISKAILTGLLVWGLFLMGSLVSNSAEV